MGTRDISVLTFGQLARTQGTMVIDSCFFLFLFFHICMLGKGRWDSISRMYLLAERVAAEERGKVVGGLVRGSNTRSLL